jgi:hypothetical protein
MARVEKRVGTCLDSGFFREAFCFHSDQPYVFGEAPEEGYRRTGKISGTNLVKKRYFPAPGNRNRTFATETSDRTPEGKMIWKRLVYASDTKIKRHVKIRRDANPFDPQWRPYFEERTFQKKFGISRV